MIEDFVLVASGRNKEIPLESGVYVFMDEDDKVIYAGSSVILRHRYAGHSIRRAAPNSKFAFKCYPASELGPKEQELIDTLKPKFNLRGKVARPALRAVGDSLISAGWRIAPNKQDRANEEKVRALMVRRGMPAQAVTISDVIRFALNLAAGVKE